MMIRETGVNPFQHGNQQRATVKPAFGHAMPRVQFGHQDKVHFGISREERKAAEEEQMAMLGGDLKEGPIQKIFRGFVPLDFLATLDIGLHGDRKKKYDAYAQLIEIALRPKNDNLSMFIDSKDRLEPRLQEAVEDYFGVGGEALERREADVRQTLENPSPELKAWMDQFGISANDLAEPVVDRVQIDKDGYVPRAVWQRMKKIGLFGLKVPKEHGGLELTQKEYDAVDRALARYGGGALAGAISAHSTIGGTLKLGSDEQKAKYYPHYARGDYMAAFGLTEPDAGTDVGRMSTTATLSPDGKHWILNGKKLYITNTQRSGVVFVFARTDLGSHQQEGARKPKHTAFIVDLPFSLNDTRAEQDDKRAALSEEGLIISPPLDLHMIRGSNQAYIEFNNYKIPYENVLGGEEKIGKGLSEPFNALNAGRAGFGPVYSESANLAYETALARTKERPMFREFGGLQKDLPAIRDKIADMAMRTEALHAISDMVSAYIEQYECEDYNIIAEAAAIKVLSTDENWEIMEMGQDILGGKGLMVQDPSGMEIAFRDAWIGKIVEGVNDAMRQLAVGTGMNRMALGELLPGAMIFPSVMRGDFGGAVKNAIKGTQGLMTLFRNRIGGRFQTGGLKNSKDVRWLHNAARQLNWKVVTLGMKHGKKMQGNQRDLIRLFNVAAGIFTMAAVLLKLEKAPDLTDKQRSALKAYVTLTKPKIQEALDEIKPSNKADKLRESVARVQLDET